MKSRDISLPVRLVRDQQGQVLPWMALLGALVVGVAGLVVDLGHAYVCYRQLQASTDAAALAGAYALALSQATPSSVQARAQAFSSVAGGVNATPNLPNATIATTLSCVTDSSLVDAPCSAGPTGNNVVQVVQQTAVPTFFIRALAAVGLNSAKTIALTAVSTATMMSGKATQVNVAVVLDTTASMGSKDTDANCNDTRIHCALSGVQTMMKHLSPCTSSSTSTNCTPFDQVSLFTYPNVQASTASNEVSCPTGNPTVLAYSTPTQGASWSAPTGSSATYQITDYLSDFSSTNQQGGSLSNSSALTVATGGSASSNCGGLQTPGGVGTYYAGAIYAAQSSLIAVQSQNPNSQNVMIILSDGDANAKSSNIAGSKNLSGNVYGSPDDQCHQAISAANYATLHGTTVYTIAYGASNSGCSSDKGSFAISPCSTLQQMASGWSSGDRSHFYSDASSSQNPGQCTGTNDYDLNGIFADIAAKFTQARLIPNGTT
jgi:Putative Flp pilus-assembly TadE/G-like